MSAPFTARRAARGRRRLGACLLGPSLLGAIFAGAAYGADPETASSDKVLEAVPLDGATITVDGRLDEPVWRAAPVASGFVQRSPVPGVVAPVDGRVRVVYDREALYVGVEFDLLPGESPRALELTRDSFRLFADDAVSLKFDVHRDRRSTVGLVINPAGAQLDYVTLDSGSQFRTEFDARWAAESTVADGVWTVEYRVPYIALGLPARGGAQAMGLNITRDHNVRQATDDWSPMPAEFGPVAATHYGRLVGLRDVGVDGLPVSFIPFALVQHPGEDALLGDDLDVRAGGDVRARLGEDLWAELTVLTDFAEVDLDDPLVNLDRFPLFLPEKRAFFLSGLDIFEFGARGLSQVFFSRRIGLDDDGGTVPLYGGLKLYGRAAGVGLGVLDVVTDGTDGAPPSNFAVARASYPFGRGGQAGLIAVSRHALDERDAFGDHYALGADAAVRLLDARLEIAGFGALTLATGPAGLDSGDANDAGDRSPPPGTSGQVTVEYLGAEWQPSVYVRRTDADFDPQVGFVRRTDVTESGAALDRVFRFAEHPIARLTLSAGGSGIWSADLADARGQRAHGGVELRSRSGWSASLEGVWNRDRVGAEFELLPGVRVPGGTYAGPQVSAYVSSPSTRAPSGYAGYTFDDGFFGGTLHRLSTGFTWPVGAHLRLFGDCAAARLDVPGGQADTLTLDAGITIAASTRLFADVAGQLNSVDDAARALLRLRWRYLPGSDIFAVYQEDLAAADGLTSSGRRITLKITWWVDALL